MIDQVRRYMCDACGEIMCLDDKADIYESGWQIGSEIGDLCPSCKNAWTNYKQSFVERMRLEKRSHLSIKEGK